MGDRYRWIGKFDAQKRQAAGKTDWTVRDDVRAKLRSSIKRASAQDAA